MNILMLDTEHGYKSLGSKEAIQKAFGLPLINITHWKQFTQLISQLYTVQQVTKDIKLGDIVVKETASVYKPNGVDIDTMVIDTGTELVKKFQRELQGKSKKLTLPQWGELKSGLDFLLEMVNRIPCSVIINLHSKLIRDDDLGVLKHIPNVEGSTKEDIGKWFDFVFYAKTKVNEKGNRTYSWVTARNDRYEQAKDRSGLLQAEIPQDYSIVLKAVKERNFDNAKVLVVGPPGSGKTKSIKTLLTKE